MKRKSLIRNIKNAKMRQRNDPMYRNAFALDKAVYKKTTTTKIHSHACNNNIEKTQHI